MTNSLPMREHLAHKLSERFSPQHLEVIDESEKHIGHAGHNGKGESHFQVIIVSESFTGKTRLERHRMVNELLQQELRERIHALSIKAYSPDERAGN